VRMVCEAVSSYICDMEILAARREKLEDKVLSLLVRNLGQNHHICLENFYIRVRVAETLLGRKARVCRIMRANKGHSTLCRTRNQPLEKRAVSFPGDIIVQVWNDKRVVQIISMIHVATIINTVKKDRKTDLEIKKPYAVFQYSKYMKGVDTADQYFSYYSVLRKTLKQSNVSAELLLSSMHVCVQNTKNKPKSKIQELPA
jgi:hypothetical protein